MKMVSEISFCGTLYNVLLIDCFHTIYLLNSNLLYHNNNEMKWMKTKNKKHKSLLLSMMVVTRVPSLCTCCSTYVIHSITILINLMHRCQNDKEILWMELVKGNFNLENRKLCIVHCIHNDDIHWLHWNLLLLFIDQ